jgi:hypothetical protein
LHLAILFGLRLIVDARLGQLARNGIDNRFQQPDNGRQLAGGQLVD